MLIGAAPRDILTETAVACLVLPGIMFQAENMFVYITSKCNSIQQQQYLVYDIYPI